MNAAVMIHWSTTQATLIMLDPSSSAGHDAVHCAFLRHHVQLPASVLAEAGDAAAGGEIGPVHLLGRLPRLVAEALHPAVAEVAVEVRPPETRDRAPPIDVAADHRAAGAVAVVDHGFGEPAPVADVDARRVAVEPFGDRPAVVGRAAATDGGSEEPTSESKSLRFLVY